MGDGPMLLVVMKPSFLNENAPEAVVGKQIVIDRVLVVKFYQ